MSNKIKIALADDEELFTTEIRFLLEREFAFNIVFEASNEKELIDVINNTEELPDIILMDLKMPGIDGIEATNTIHKMHPAINIIAITSYVGKFFITNMIDIGASSYLLKESNPIKVINAIKKYLKTLSKRGIEILEFTYLYYSTLKITDNIFINARTV